MTTKELAYEYRLAQWAALAKERVEQGLSIRAYCAMKGFAENTYFYWQRRLRAAAAGEHGLRVQEESKQPCVSFSEVRMTTKPEDAPARQPGQLRLSVGGVEMTVDSAYPVDQLAVLLRTLARPC